MTERGDRGQAITLNYALGLAIGVVLITGLLIAGASFVDGQREQAIRTELQVIGQQLSADMSTADRLAQTTRTNSTVEIRRSMPADVAGGTYNVQVVAGPDAHLLLTTDNPAVEVRVELANETDVQAARINGGRLRIVQEDDGNITLKSGGSV
jgi:hypothetical protein